MAQIEALERAKADTIARVLEIRQIIAGEVEKAEVMGKGTEIVGDLEEAASGEREK
jgi:hypothetical protein